MLGRPRKYDKKITHDGERITYTFVKDAYKVTFVPEKEPLKPPDNVRSPPTATLKTIKGKAKESMILLTQTLFEDEFRESKSIIFLVAKEEIDSPGVSPNPTFIVRI